MATLEFTKPGPAAAIKRLDSMNKWTGESRGGQTVFGSLELIDCKICCQGQGHWTKALKSRSYRENDAYKQSAGQNQALTRRRFLPGILSNSSFEEANKV